MSNPTQESAQQKTIHSYQGLQRIVATGHLLRLGREFGVFAVLQDGQKTLLDLVDVTGLTERRTEWLLRALVTIGIIEKYREDYAISATGRLLTPHDADFGESMWQSAGEELRGPESEGDTEELRERFDSISASQWTHTATAIEVAEMLDDGDPQESKRLLDVGCGAGVFSAAMAYRRPHLSVVGFDIGESIALARATADSIGLQQRFETREGDLRLHELPEGPFDEVLIAQRLQALPESEGDTLLRDCVSRLAPGGRLMVIDSFGPIDTASLAQCVEAFRMTLQVGRDPADPVAVGHRMREAGLENIQYTPIAASGIGLAMLVGRRPGQP